MIEAEAWPDKIPATANPWQDWFSMLQFPTEPSFFECRPDRIWYRVGCESLEDITAENETEYEIQELMHDADQWRLVVEPKTTHFARKWNRFREHHELMEATNKSRRIRYLIWRSAALKVLFDQIKMRFNQDRFNDALVAIMTERGFKGLPGRLTGMDFWQVSTTSPKAQHYAVTVLFIIGHTKRCIHTPQPETWRQLLLLQRVAELEDAIKAAFSIDGKHYRAPPSVYNIMNDTIMALETDDLDEAEQCCYAAEATIIEERAIFQGQCLLDGGDHATRH